MRYRITLAAIAAALASLAHAEAPADQWNLADLYPAIADWNADAAKADAQMKQLGACKGHLTDSAAQLRKCLDLQADLDKRLARMGVYAGELLAADTSVASSRELQQRWDQLHAKTSEAESFVAPELLRAGKAKVERLMTQDAGLATYHRPISEILRAAPHTLDATSEKLLAQLSLLDGAGGEVHSTLTDTDIPWPTVQLSTGEKLEINPTSYTKYRESASQDDRKRVMDAFFGTFKTYEHTLGLTLYAQLKEDAVKAKVRNYPDSISRALDANNVPVAVIDTLIRETNANLPTLHRYFKLRARMLGVSQMHYYDIYPPLVHGSPRYSLAQAKQLTLAAVAPLGNDYVNVMAKGFDTRWMDAYPRPHKRSGAHMDGAAYDVHPLVLLNFNDDYESVSTLAHEWGHAMHSYLSNTNQPFVTSDYPIFIAEIASTFNEEMLLDHMLKIAKSDDERLLYLGSALENLRGTFFRQAMFAEFERAVHARVDAGEPMTGEAFTKTYCDILKRHHGTEQGVVAIDDVDCQEWAYIPHFYSSFYVYQYATSVAASAMLAERVLANEPGARDAYLTLLRSGASDDAYKLVKKAGVDLASPAPYRALVARMNGIMDSIDAILAKRGKTQ